MLFWTKFKTNKTEEKKTKWESAKQICILHYANCSLKYKLKDNRSTYDIDLKNNTPLVLPKIIKTNRLVSFFYICRCNISKVS